MVFHLSPTHLLILNQPLPHRMYTLTRQHLPPQRQCTRMSHHPSVYYAFLPHVRLFCFLVVTSLRARNVLSTWSNSAQAATSFIPKTHRPQVERAVMLPLLRVQRQSPPSLPRTYGESERQKAGSAPFVANVSSIYIDCVLS